MPVATLADFTDADACPRIVVKVGSALLVGEDGAARRAWLDTLVGELAAAHARGQQVIVVSSGAIALGARKLGLGKGTVPVKGTRTIGKADMILNDARPQIEVNPETYEVRADGEVLICAPATSLPLAQRYFLY